MRIVVQLDGEGFSVIVREDGDGRVFFKSDADIDADGAPHAYHPVNSKGLDDIRNAKDQNGRFVGVLTDRHGRPIIQDIDDPAEGYFISTTSYEHDDQPTATQRRYLNSETVPFIVVSPKIRNGVKGVVLGCQARITYKGKSIEALVGDMGPLRKVGEISIAAAKALGIPSSPRTGGLDEPVVLYELWPGKPAVVNGVKYELKPA